jgi:prepilin-type N-terminal cleavage/methylation domain-containing protein
MRTQDGFSLIELVVALALTVTVLAAVFTAIDPANGWFATEPEVADMQQRLRVAAHTLADDLLTAGARSGTTASLGSGAAPFPAVLPYRLGPLNARPPASAAGDVLTVVSVPAASAETRIESAIRGPSAAIMIVAGPGCPWSGGGRDPACGLRPGATVLVRDQEGFDVFAVSSVAGSSVVLEQVRNALARPFESGSRIVEIVATTYYLRADEETRTYQLMRYNGRNSDAPVVDHLVSLAFEYFGQSASVGGGQIALAPSDVARNQPPIVRRVRLRVRVQAAAESLRGPAGALFLHGGSARQARRWAPDLETTVDVALRNAGLDP